jgi:hypothetical protein
MFAALAWDKFLAWLVFAATLTVTMTLNLESPLALLKGFGNIGVLTIGTSILICADPMLFGRPMAFSDNSGVAPVAYIPPTTGNRLVAAPTGARTNL